MIAWFAVTFAAPALASEYPCLSDPGFCYFDVASDGCFDLPADVGPIDAQLAAGDYPSPLPPGPVELPATAGSIVCPPSVKKLIVQASPRWRTALGSDILLYGTKVDSAHRIVELVSGRDLMVADLKLRDRVLGGGPSYILLRGERDVRLTKRILEISNGGKSVEVTAATGDIIGEEKASLVGRGSHAEFSAGGDINLRRFRFKGSDLELAAGGEVLLEAPNIKSLYFEATGAAFTSTGRTKMKLKGGGFPPGSFVDVTGDVSFEQLSLGGSTTRFTLAGASVSILGLVNGKPRRSAMKFDDGHFRVNATDDILLRELRVTGLYGSNGASAFETTGDSVSILDSYFGGIAVLVEVSAGAGSTCDLTGTTLQNGGAPTTSCDTVIGP